MTDEQRWIYIERALNEHSRQLIDISNTLNYIAVQKERIDEHDRKINALWRKYDEIIFPTINELSRFQAACPKREIHILWFVIIPLALTLAGIAYKLFSGGE